MKRCAGFAWPGTELREYKPEPGAHEGVTRRLVSKLDLAGIETRYFEVETGGYSSFERHEHEHLVVIVRGVGEVRLGDDVLPVEPFDIVEVASRMPHQFKNTGPEPFGFLCVVTCARDRPEALTADTVGVVERPTNTP